MKIKIHCLLLIASITIIFVSCGSGSIHHNYSLKDEYLLRQDEVFSDALLNPINVYQISGLGELYLPIVLKNFPYISVFGMASSTDFQKITSTRVDWIRLTNYLNWAEVQEEENGEYQWAKVSYLEDKIREINNLGLKVILTIGGTPKWAQKYQSDCSLILPSQLDNFTKFVGEAVKRYSQPQFNIEYYMIYNEPDMPYCWGEYSYPNDKFFGGEYYGQLLRKVYPIVKNSNPAAKVVVGGLLLDCDPREVGSGFCPTWEEASKWNFFEGVVRSAGNSFDLVGFHTYAYYHETGDQNSPVWKERNREKWRNSGGVVDGKARYLREVMQKYNINKPLLITEAGLLFSDQPFPDSETERNYENQKADYLIWVYANSWSNGIRGVTWYAFEGWRKTEMIRNGQQLPAFKALETMVSFLKFAEYIFREEYAGFTKFVYRNGNEIIWLLIPTGQQYGTMYSIPAPSKLKRVVDLFGNDQTVSESNIAFTRPVYIFINP